MNVMQVQSQKHRYQICTGNFVIGDNYEVEIKNVISPITELEDQTQKLLKIFLNDLKLGNCTISEEHTDLHLLNKTIRIKRLTITKVVKNSTVGL